MGWSHADLWSNPRPYKGSKVINYRAIPKKKKGVRGGHPSFLFRARSLVPPGSCKPKTCRLQ